MPFVFSPASRERLSTCHPELIRLCEAVLLRWDCTVVCGHRGEVAQNEAFRTGKSMKRFPESKHNAFPSLAVDLAPCYPAPVGIPWDDSKAFILFGGFVLGVASQLGIPLIWGGDWNRDRRFNEKFVDMPHFELMG